MCAPVMPMVGPMMGALGQLAVFQGQQQQYAAKEQVYTQNIANALADNRADETALLTRQMEEIAAYSGRDHAALLEGAEKQAQVRVAAAGANVTGLSVDSIVEGIGQQIDAKRAILQTNWRNTAVQLQSQKDTDVAQEMNRMTDVPAPYSPNPLGAVAGAVGDIAGGASKMPSMFGTPSPSGGLNDISSQAPQVEGGGIGMN